MDDGPVTRSELKQELAGVEERIVEHMRDMQTELLRGMEAFANSMSIRMRKLEVDQSNLDASVAGRLAALEARLMQIEKRLGLPGQQS